MVSRKATFGLGQLYRLLYSVLLQLADYNIKMLVAHTIEQCLSVRRIIDCA